MFPHYQHLNLANDSPAYVNQNLPFHVKKCIAQLRIDKIPIELNNTQLNIRYLTDCPLCHSHLPNSLTFKHLLLQCQALAEIDPHQSLNDTLIADLSHDVNFVIPLTNLTPKDCFALYNLSQKRLKLFTALLDELTGKIPTSPHHTP